MEQPVHRFHYLVAESAMIVLSILAAFALDAWWDGLQEREAEQAHLAALQADFLETSARLAVTEQHEMRVISNTRRLLGIGDEPVPKGKALDAMLFDVWSLPALEPVNGSVEDLISSGQLRLIRDERLRSALAAWDSDVEQYQRREGWAQDNWNLLVAPFVTREMSIAQLAKDYLEDLPDDPDPRDHSELLGDRYTRNLLVHRWITAKDVLASLQRLRERCDLILARLDESGGGRAPD